MKAGDLNREIKLQERVAGIDSEGQPVGGWVDHDASTIWASVRGATGMGAIKGAMQGATEINAYSFRIRYRTDVTAAMRVVEIDGGEVYDVKQVRHDKAGRVWTDLVCELGGNDG